MSTEVDFSLTFYTVPLNDLKMKAGLLLFILLVSSSLGFAVGLSLVEINGNTYSNITKVYISGGNRVVLLYPDGGTSAKLNDVPQKFLVSWGISQEEQGAVKAASLDSAIRNGSFRYVNGIVYDIRKSQSGWVSFNSVKMFQITDDGSLVDTTPGSSSYTLIFVKNLPNTIGDKDFVSFTVIADGTYSYINKLGDSRTVRQYNFGRICSRDEIPASVLAGDKAFDASPIRGKPAVDVLGKLPESDDLVASGSGFFISSDGYFITNDHVVRNARKVKVKIGTNDWSAVVLREDVTNDLALLKVNGTFKALPISAGDATLGQPVFTIGFPDIKLQGTEPKYTDGKISSLAGLRDDPLEYQVSVPVQPGNSGGPLVDQVGNVCGVIVARLDDMAALASVGSLPQNVNYAIKGSVLRKFLAQSPEIKQAVADDTDGNAVNSVRNSVAIVLVY